MAAKLKTADFALFGALWWPKANFHELKIVTSFSIWLFLWDDQLDEPTGDHAGSLEQGDKYRKETLQFIAACLGFASSDEEPPEASEPIIESFREIGQALRAAYSFGELIGNSRGLCRSRSFRTA